MAHDEDYNYLYKIVLVGDTNVGKTNLLSRYTKNSLPEISSPTAGVEFATHIVSLPAGVTVKAQIWDTAGQERYHATVSGHYRRAIGALLVYDVTNFESFENAQKWIQELKSKADPDIVIMLVGNKIDLADRNPDLKQVSTDQAKSFAQSEGLLHIETSAFTSDRVREAFELLLEQIYESKSKGNKETKPLSIQPGPAPIKGSCC